MRWLTVTHAQRWHAAHGTTGTGSLYQGRFKSFPVQEDEHFLTVCRYVERNPLRANLVSRAELWKWSSLWTWNSAATTVPLAKWPLPLPTDWIEYVNAPQSEQELDAVRRSVVRSRPFGEAEWTLKTAKSLGLEHTLRIAGRSQH
jgi:REP-associated tyrosine transposase